MLLSIYWGGYITMLLVILIPYYVFVLLKYYRKELSGLVRWASAQQKTGTNAMDEETDEDVPGLRVAFQAGNMESNEADTGKKDKVLQEEKVIAAEGTRITAEDRKGSAEEPEEWRPPAKEIRSLFPLAHELTTELKDLIAKAGKAGIVREELIWSIKGLLNKERYRALKEPPFRVAINMGMVLDVEYHCSIRLDAGELERVWGG
ncbi:MAG TPA: hypothetical protein VGN00_29990 [Puia sp.]|jgi:hypothetical protein